MVRILVSQPTKDAINYPNATPPKIVLSRQGWDQLRDKNGLLRRKLVLHELLGIMGVDDSKYQVSTALYSNSVIGNPCWADEKNVDQLAIQKWKRSGHNVTSENIDVGNGGSTTDGVYIQIVRGYEIKDGESVNALLFAAQCNSVLGKYEELLYSGSGTNLSPSCEGPAGRFCTAK